MRRRPLVVVGSDGSYSAEAAVEYAVDKAASLGARLRLVTAYPALQDLSVPHGLAAPATPEDVGRRLEERARAHVDRLLERRGATNRVAVQVRALPGPAARVLLDQAEDADMLVVGRRGRGGCAGLLLGSVSLHCVLHAPCTVVVVPPAGPPAERPEGEPASAFWLAPAW